MIRVDGQPSLLLVDASGGAGLAPVLERCRFAVTQSATPEAALFEFGQHEFAAVVAVRPLPGLGAAGLCRELRIRSRTPVLVVTSGGGSDWLEAISAGADDHVSVPCNESELRARLRSLIRRVRGSVSPTHVLIVGELVVRSGRGVVSVEPNLPLTPVQSTLLGHLAGHPGRVVSESALVELVWSVHGPVTEVQFDVELDTLCIAIEVASGIPSAIQRLNGTGWCLLAERS